MAALVAFVLVLLAAAMLIVGLIADAEFRKENRWLSVIALALFVSLVLSLPARAAWRGEFLEIASVTELEIGTAVELSCEVDESHPDWRFLAHPPDWQRWEAQVLSELSPGVYKLGNFPDMMAQIETNLDLWSVIDGEWIETTELPHVEFTNFMVNWPEKHEEGSPHHVGHITMTYAAGAWSIDSHTRIRRFGLCGANPQYDLMTGNKIQVAWNEAAGRFEGIAEVVGLPGFCPNPKTQPYYCEVSQVRCQDYCAYLSEYDGRYEDLADRWRRYVNNYGYSPEEGQFIFEWQLAKLEAHTATNGCKQAGDDATAPQTIYGQCEILQELIDINRGWPGRLAVFVPQYQRLGCPCAVDVSPANGLPDYFDYTDPASECPDVLTVPETNAHEAYLIPVPEPGTVLQLIVGLGALAGLYRVRRG